ncbi:Undecaprenyl-phosphate 4-deoxy-4-formamido-L-arabinose transferase protein [Marine Group I thaumarchaeote SCGC AAA799-P11]|uniref:Undecaprenyl-phosphate 4-deoxy-4-formamido-L-arabinose transferase protein n=1 Tax=Marine Group I thaumarchaeote SCGC AAA799-P11 TaxID=1502295 RepID=A0A087S2X8_9ARCH|nr:Undecaprenyl-phosphate 4-deoxy-4-formamido-L-arabinose transferase protein [Marine Group I thaumarchaeote SCGC AAA799-P11]
MLYLLACIPAYNEEGVIGDLIKKTLPLVDSVVVCDDGSTDLTSKEAKDAGSFVITHSENKGKGAALKSLFDFAKHSNADIIITIDGDGQFLPEEIPKLIKDVEDKKSDIVIGYRFETEKDMPSYRKFGNKILDELSKKAAHLNLRDTQSGFRAYSKHAIANINFKNDGFAADSEILVDASEKNMKISEQHVTVLYDTGSRTSTQNPVRQGGSVLIHLLELVLMKRPLTFLGIPGFIMLIAGIIASSITMTIFNETRYFSIPTTLVSMILFIVGIMLLLVSGILFSFNRTTHNNR